MTNKLSGAAGSNAGWSVGAISVSPVSEPVMVNLGPSHITTWGAQDIINKTMADLGHQNWLQQQYAEAQRRNAQVGSWMTEVAGSNYIDRKSKNKKLLLTRRG